MNSQCGPTKVSGRFAAIVSAVLFIVALCSVNVAYAQIPFLFPSTTKPTLTNATSTKAMMGANITGSIPIGPTMVKAIASQVHVSLGNASTTAEKAVGANAHSIAVRIGTVHGFLVYMALVHDMNTGTLHGVLVDPGNGKVLASTPIPFGALGMMMGGGGMMGPGMGMMDR